MQCNDSAIYFSSLSSSSVCGTNENIFPNKHSKTSLFSRCSRCGKQRIVPGHQGTLKTIRQLNDFTSVFSNFLKVAVPKHGAATSFVLYVIQTGHPNASVGFHFRVSQNERSMHELEWSRFRRTTINKLYR